MSVLGELLTGVLERGERARKADRGGGKKLCPTNSERMNRALVELSSSAFKLHMLMWKWRGAPAKGKLPFFTIHSLGRFCGMTRPTVRSGLRELVCKGWIVKLGYDGRRKNELYRLVPIKGICDRR